ncbi:PQQ-dependent sugar dehydrogenase [Tessaracoccus sp. SD287]|uniref:PQQ-dependent sugar dehydrogenase n=1 Tax=Tessaracoccus sp. SD287 TaxID=2782008 RepID=UPI001A978258|nr:PQQ-dependent sugar dehydrogenase [Tessaracoccus sp. SD287]MBO1030821.1 PQQ-dependent sugar dehydrogenase [Tessaracoccus sp. SD287]
MTTRRTVLLGGLSLAGLAACTSQGSSETASAPTSQTPGGSPATSAPASTTPSTTIASSPGPTALSIGTPTDLVTGLTTPWGLRAIDEDTLLVSERDTGAIKVVRDGLATQIGEVQGVRASGEAGLLGIELSTDKRALFVYLSTSQDNRVLRYDFTGSSFSDPRVLLKGIPAAGFHNGGQLVMGPDGHLYISTGDASRRQSAQDRNSLAGKVLRIAVDGSVPSDNPFGNPVWSLGHRNVQGLTFAPDGALWSAEFGDKSADELNLITKGGNYGWPEVEGNQGQRAPFLAPKATWEPTASSSPSSLAFAQGNVWVASLIGSTLFQVPINGTEAGTPVAHFADQYGRLRAVVAHRDGIVFGTSNTDGRSSARAGDDRLVYLPLR